MNRFKIMIILFLFLLAACGEQKSDKPGFAEKFNNKNNTAQDGAIDTAKKGISEARPGTYIEGWVAYFTDTFLGSEGRINKEKAKLLNKLGQILVLMNGPEQNGTIYFVYDKNGNIASNWLSDYAEYKKIRVYGRVVVVDEINVIFAERIEPSE